MASILEMVNDPADIRGLDLRELNQLAEEVRHFILKTVSATGGHLASSLGVVELTLAVHKVFDTPRDKVLWDVGHQSYAHKIITGRRDRFCTLRQRGGVCGFPKKRESIYDTFDMGHSGNSISVATGMAEARRLSGDSHKIVVIIGDGSLTAGLAFEGLNWAGYRKEDIIIILNDNEMSISQNVGALSAYLNRIMTGHAMRKLKAEIKSLFRNIPSIGEYMIRFSRQLEETLKALILPGALFEDLGFTYVGPIQGHRLDYLIDTMSNIKELTGPVLLHVLTKKGKGYRYAEEQPRKYHSTGPFDVETGEPVVQENDINVPTYTEVFGSTIVHLARENRRIVAITAAMCDGTGLNSFAHEFPDRFFDVGIAEQHSVTFAAGLAAGGYIPIVAVYSTFLQRAYDSIIHDVCLQELHVVFVIDRAGFVGEDGATHQGLFDLTYLRSIPNMVVMSPKDENELRHMLKTAVEYHGPVAVRYPRGKAVGVPMDDELDILPIGKGEVLREGNDAAILAIGSTVQPALLAAEVLEKEGLSVCVVNARFVKPLDENLICQIAEKTKKIVTVEENTLMGGFGSALLELLAEKGIFDCRVLRIGIPDCFVEHATQKELRSAYGLDENGIANAVRLIVSR
ncbi:MAG: 1-deoxy-D-xylulose-5-phosphate synthase [Syntrophales bacterium]|nr:1-deoxy-D-xylulose-5-phosphate synthase [Syntrophales bacterium]